MNKYDLIELVSKMEVMTIEPLYASRDWPLFFISPLDNSAESTHIKNNGEPYKHKGKRKMRVK